MTSKVSAKKAQNQQSPVSQSYQVISSCIPDWHDSYLSSCHWADRIPNLAISSGRCEQMDMGWTSSSSVEGDGEGFGGLWICDCRERWLCPQKARVHKQIGYCWSLIMPDTQQCREYHNGFPLSWASRLHCKKPHYDTVSPWINQRKWSSLTSCPSTGHRLGDCRDSHSQACPHDRRVLSMMLADSDAVHFFNSREQLIIPPFLKPCSYLQTDVCKVFTITRLRHAIQPAGESPDRCRK